MLDSNHLKQRHQTVRHPTVAPADRTIQHPPLRATEKESEFRIVCVYKLEFCIQLSYYSELGQIILVQKPGKPPLEVTSYRPISLLPIISKILEKLLTARLNSNNILDELLPDHQFGFRRYHSTIQQCHRVITIINETLDANELCPTVYLDIKQAFDKVWHRGLLYKIKQNLPSEY